MPLDDHGRASNRLEALLAEGHGRSTHKISLRSWRRLDDLKLGHPWKHSGVLWRSWKLSASLVGLGPLWKPMEALGRRGNAAESLETPWKHLQTLGQKIGPWKRLVLVAV